MYQIVCLNTRFLKLFSQIYSDCTLINKCMLVKGLDILITPADEHYTKNTTVLFSVE